MCNKNLKKQLLNFGVAVLQHNNTADLSESFLVHYTDLPVAQYMLQSGRDFGKDDRVIYCADLSRSGMVRNAEMYAVIVENDQRKYVLKARGQFAAGEDVDIHAGIWVYHGQDHAVFKDEIDSECIKTYKNGLLRSSILYGPRRRIETVYDEKGQKQELRSYDMNHLLRSHIRYEGGQLAAWNEYQADGSFKMQRLYHKNGVISEHKRLDRAEYGYNRYDGNGNLLEDKIIALDGASQKKRIYAQDGRSVQEEFRIKNDIYEYISFNADGYYDRTEEYNNRGDLLKAFVWNEDGGRNEQVRKLYQHEMKASVQQEKWQDIVQEMQLFGAELAKPSCVKIAPAALKNELLHLKLN